MSGTGRRGGFNPLIAGFIAGVTMALVIGLMAKINIDFAAPWAHTHTVTAQVSDIDGISIGSDVRIAGRLVGQITAVKAQGDHSSVTFHIDDSEWPLPVDTSASVRLATLLGQKYIQLVPGSDKTHAIADDGTIPLTATKPVVDFDQILNTFDKPTRDSLTNLIKTAGAAVQGQEGNLQQLIPNLRDLSVHSVTPTQELVTRNPEINNILVNLGTTADQLNQSRNDLAGVIDNMNSITGALARNQAALEGYITNVDQINQTTDKVLGNGGAAEFNAGLQQLSKLANYANTLVNNLIPQSASFTSAVTYTGLHPYQDAVNLVYSIGSATSQSDRNGFFLRQDANGADPCGLTPLCGSPSLPAGTGAGGSGGGTVCVPLPGAPCVTTPLPLPLPLPLPPVTVPTPVPLPTPAPTPASNPCLLPPFCLSAAAYDPALSDALISWGWL
jgi:virulence factor Mce-like protein